MKPYQSFTDIFIPDRNRYYTIKGRWSSWKRYVCATSDSDFVLEEKMDNIKADFDYAMDGLDKLSRMGLEKSALVIADELHNALPSIFESISDEITN